MYNFTDIIKNRFLEEFTEITIEALLTSLVLSCILSCFVILIYRITYSGVLFNRGFALSLVLLSMVTSLVIITVSSNVVLSLGMVGALSIVRFRTAVKEPMDTIFMFWAIVIGITTGAGLVPTAIIATLLIGVIFLIINLFGTGLKVSAYLVVIRYEEDASSNVKRALKSLRSSKIKSCSSTKNGEEIVVEARFSKTAQQAFDTIQKIEGVHEVNIVSYGGSTLL